MALTQQQARLLSALTHTIRTDWNEDGIMAALGKVKDRNAAAVILATIRAADDKGAKTPGVIPTSGPHWNEKLRDPEPFRPPRKHEECPLHAGQWRDTCSGCASDRLTGERTTPAELRKPDVTNHLARARAELASAKANEQARLAAIAARREAETTEETTNA